MLSRRVILLILFSLSGCTRNDEVALRRFPYPYQAALAICSDIDETNSIDEFLAIQTFLNTTGETELGRGLGLEIGNSFWFYNQYTQLKNDYPAVDTMLLDSFSGNPDFGISLYAGTSYRLSDYAPVLIALIRAGYLDCLHSYGNFTEGGFDRALALRAAEFFDSAAVAVDVFVNHGGPENQHNIGDAPFHLGDNPEAACYHTDLTVPLGVKFVWCGRLTHAIGQNGDFSLLTLGKLTYEYFHNLIHAGPLCPSGNNLVFVRRLDDGRPVFEFVRYINPWGKYSATSEEYITHQLGKDEVDRLIRNRGYMIFYTHLGKNSGAPYLSESTVEALRYIKKRYDAGELLVTTTSQLLNYHIHHKDLYWRSEESLAGVHIIIDSIANEVEGTFIPDVKDLAGLTFYVPEGRQVLLTVAGHPVLFTRHPKDDSGRPSISIPWPRCEFPDLGGPDVRAC